MKDVKNIIKGNTELEFVFDEECNAVKETIYINGYKERFIKFDFVTGCNVYNSAIQSGYVPDDTNANKLLTQELSEAPEYKDNRPLYNPEEKVEDRPIYYKDVHQAQYSLDDVTITKLQDTHDMLERVCKDNLRVQTHAMTYRQFKTMIFMVSKYKDCEAVPAFATVQTANQLIWRWNYMPKTLRETKLDEYQLMLDFSKQYPAVYKRLYADGVKKNILKPAKKHDERITKHQWLVKGVSAFRFTIYGKDLYVTQYSYFRKVVCAPVDKHTFITYYNKLIACDYRIDSKESYAKEVD